MAPIETQIRRDPLTPRSAEARLVATFELRMVYEALDHGT